MIKKQIQENIFCKKIIWALIIKQKEILLKIIIDVDGTEK